MMGCTAVWTAVHYRIPLLFVVANNRSFYNDEVHQERVARRAQPPGRQQVDRPAHQRSGHRHRRRSARGQGAKGFGPCDNAGELEKALKEAIAVVEGGGVAVVDARILRRLQPGDRGGDGARQGRSAAPETESAVEHRDA